MSPMVPGKGEAPTSPPRPPPLDPTTASRFEQHRGNAAAALIEAKPRSYPDRPPLPFPPDPSLHLSRRQRRRAARTTPKPVDVDALYAQVGLAAGGPRDWIAAAEADFDHAHNVKVKGCCCARCNAIRFGRTPPPQPPRPDPGRRSRV